VSGGQKPVLADPATGPTGMIQRAIMGVPVFLSSQLPVNETQGSSSVASSIYIVEAAQCVIVIRVDLTTVVDRSVKFTSDVTAVRAILRIDTVVPFPSAA
jgi:HK97 family phage major capsid protein